MKTKYHYLEPLPDEGQRVIIHYKCSSSNSVWFKDNTFVNKYGFELFNILSWEHLNTSDTEKKLSKPDFTIIA